jgi:urease accessory protein
MLPARSISRAHQGATADSVTLSYDERFLRRKRLTTDAGASFLVDLAETTSLNHGDAFLLDDGRKIAVRAAEEPVVRVSGNLPRLAWHIGNRHTPCQITPDHLVIRRDPVIEAMLKGLGATLTLHIEAFTPEGGAYGHGRTMGHDHGGNDHGPAGQFARSHV